MSTGLVLGKFAPLHSGHQHLIETALAEVDDVIVLIYNCPEIDISPLSVRADWIRCIYPDVEVIEAWDGPTVLGDTPDIRAMHEDYIRKALGSRKVTHFYSGEFYGDHVSKSLSAVDRRIERPSGGVSGTAIRSDPYRYRQHLHPIVYRDLVTTVVLLGAPST